MKIIQANNYHYIRGGAEKVYLEEAELLQERGHEVAVLSKHHPRNLPSKYSGYFASAMDLEAPGLLSRASIPFRMLYSFEARRNLVRLIRDTGAEIVHAHNIYGRLTTSVIDAASESGIPFVMTAHDYKLLCPSYSMLDHGKPCQLCLKGGLYHCLLTRCHKDSLLSSSVYTMESYFNRVLGKYDRVSRILCPSRFMMGLLEQGGIAPERLAYVPNPVTLGPTPPAQEAASGEYALFAGRVSPEKGLLTLLKAMQGLDFRLKVAGEGPDLAKCKSYVEEHKLDKVRFEGYKTGAALEALYRGAAFIVVPSECYDNAPLSILEAFSYCKPVIGSAIGGIPELVQDGLTGYLYPPFDGDALKERLTLLAGQPAMAREMGLRAWQKVSRENCREAHYAALMRAYEAAQQPTGGLQ